MRSGSFNGSARGGVGGSPVLGATAAASSGGLSSSSGGVKRSLFVPPSAALLSSIAGVQKALFHSSAGRAFGQLASGLGPHEEVLHVLQVSLRARKDEGFSGFDDGGDEQAYFLALTVNTQIKKSVDGFGAPKMHWIKIKGAEGGYVTHKKLKLMKSLRRVELPSSASLAAAPTSFTSASSSPRAQSSQGSLKRGASNANLTAGGGSGGTEEFTLVFLTSGNQDKPHTFAVRGAGANASAARALFVFYCLEVCRINCGFVPSSNVDTVLYQQLTSEITSYFLSPEGNAAYLSGGGVLGPAHRELLAGVSKNRHESLQSDARSLDRSNIEEKVVVPSMTTEETKLVQHFLKQIDEQQQQQQGEAAGDASLGISIGGAGGVPSHSHINRLESFLTAKLSALETANIASLFDARVEARSAVLLEESLQKTLLDNRLEEMSLWINHHNQELSKMQKGMEQIETRNLSLDIQEKNQTRLHATLRSVLDALKLDGPDADSDTEEMNGGSVEELLRNPDFSSARLERTLAAAQRLDHILHVQIEGGKLEDLRAVKEQRGRYEGVRKNFTRACAQALEQIFGETAKRAVNEATRASMTDAGASSLSLSTNAPQHRDLRRYQSLLRYLQRLELDLFLSLRPSYARAFHSVYESKFRAYFAALRRSVAQEHKDTRMAAFPDWSAEVARSAVRKIDSASGGRSISVAPGNPAVNALLRQGPNAGLPPTQQGKLLATQAFVQALKNIAPLCLSEEKFLTDFFGLDNGAAAAANDTGTHTMMAELFRGLEPELRELAVAGGKMDHLYTLEMLVQCERIMDSSSGVAASSPSGGGSSSSVSSSSSYLSSIVTSLSTHLKLSFNQFVDGEIEWLQGQKVNPKRCGVLQPFLRFPALVDRMENVVAPGGADSITPRGSSSGGGHVFPRSQAADTSYQKLSSALFRWLESVARMDDKYTDVVVMENAHFFHEVFQAPHLRVPALESAVERTGTLYDTHCRRYVEWNIGYEMPALLEFWNRLEEQIKSIVPEDIPFAAGLSKHDLRALFKGPLAVKTLQKSLINVLKRVEKHMPKNPGMIAVVWKQIQATFLARFARFEKLVADCYSNEKLATTQQDVQELFAQILPAAPAAGSAAAPARAAYESEPSRSRLAR